MTRHDDETGYPDAPDRAGADTTGRAEMSARRREAPAGGLAARLRAGDPARDAEMTPEAAARLRRSIVEAAERPAPRTRPALVAGLATAALAMLALALWLAAGTDPGPSLTAGAPPPSRPGGAAGPARDPGDPGTPEATGQRSPDGGANGPVAGRVPPPPDPLAGITADTPHAGRPGDDETTTTPSPPPDTDRKARTVQFTAPRGTRIIWTLNPNLELPAAPGTQGEKPR